jgi:hypothetical protein
VSAGVFSDPVTAARDRGGGVGGGGGTNVGVETMTNVGVSRGGRCRFTEAIGRCRFTEGRTRGGSLPLAALIGSIDYVVLVVSFN